MYNCKIKCTTAKKWHNCIIARRKVQLPKNGTTAKQNVHLGKKMHNNSAKHIFIAVAHFLAILNY
jgi:hypothetical protein